MSYYKPVSRLLTAANGDLKSLLERAHYLQSLTRALRKTIDPVLASHITVANFRGDTAIVAADTPAWLSKIRYMAPTILEVLQQQSGLGDLRKIQFKVQPPMEPPVSDQGSRQASLSSTGSKILESAAEGIQDPGLADALRRLSRRK